MLGKGRAVAITADDIARLADELACHPADLEAIADVESKGFGWFVNGRMKILFEKHWFYKYLSGDIRKAAVKNGLARAKFVRPQNGGYKDQNTSDQRYSLLERAAKINREGAFKSISMGTFQIMGFNHEICGFKTAEGMFHAFCDSELAQLQAFANFLKAKKLVPAIRSRDFARIEEVYNGGGLGGAYAKRMKEASDKLRKSKWANYKPGSVAAKPEPKPTPMPAPTPAPKAPEAPEAPKSNGLVTAAYALAAAAAMAAATFFGNITDWVRSFF